MSINWEAKWDAFVNSFVTNNGYESVLNGLGNTVLIAIFGLLIGIVIGTVIAIIRVTPHYRVVPNILDKICAVYVGFFRGTPIVLVTAGLMAIAFFGFSGLI